MIRHVTVVKNVRLPFVVGFLHVDFGSGAFFAGFVGVVFGVILSVAHGLGDFPELSGAELEVAVGFGFVPVDLVVQFVGLGVVVDDEALVVFGALVHDLAEGFKGFEHAGKVVKDASAVRDVVLSQNEGVVDVGAEIGGNAEWVLHGDDEHDFPVASVHEEEAHDFVAGPRRVVEAVVEDDKGAWIDGGAVVLFGFSVHLFEGGFLAQEDVFDDGGVVLVVDEQARDHASVEAVAFFCAGNDGADGNVSLVKQKVAHEERFAGVSLADHDNDGAFGFVASELDVAHVKLFQLEGGGQGGRCHGNAKRSSTGVKWRAKKGDIFRRTNE